MLVGTTSGLEGLDDDLLARLTEAEVGNPHVIAALLRGAFERSHHDGRKIDVLLRNFVRCTLTRLQTKYDELFALFWDDPDISRDEFRRYSAEFLFPRDKLDWPWPITEPPPSRGASEPHFDSKYSGLWLCGYRVGKTKGMPKEERERFLDYFLRNSLPFIVARYHGDLYSELGSEQSLKKIADVIASNCKNFKLNDRQKIPTCNQ